MAQANFGALIGQVGADLHLDTSSGSEDETTIRNALNWAGRYIWTAFTWPERKAETVLTTVAPYTTGTATLTANSASVTGSGTTWTGFAKRKIALAYNLPFYRVLSVGSATALTLARNYIEDTVAASAYVVYQDEYDTSSVVDVITSATLLLSQTTGPILQVSEDRIDAEATIQAYAGKPHSVGICIPTTTGVPRVRVSPVPDDVYAIHLKYLKMWADMTNATDTPLLDANKESLLISVAHLFAQRSGDNRVLIDYDRADALISTYAKKNQSQAPMTFRRKRFDERGSQDWVYYNVP